MTDIPSPIYCLHWGCVGSNSRRAHPHSKDFNMLRYAVIFIVIALIAAVFGFGGIASSAAGIAQILFVLFLILAVGAFFFGRGK
jgi:uncharacterized membrane protein YtjA (UPF0391 family)